MTRSASVLPLLALSAVLLFSACGGKSDQPSSGAAGESGAGWALVVGISKYDHFPPLADGVSRARRMEQVFHTTWGVPQSHIKTLFDGDATYDAIRDAFVKWLPGVVKADDQVLVFLSGYGSTIEDISGDEKDGLDDGFCAVDALLDTYRKDILDDSLTYWLDKLPTQRVTLITEGQHPGLGDFDVGHPQGDATARQYPPMEAVSVTRCGQKPVASTSSSTSSH